MRPKRFYMGINHGTEAPSNLLFFDTESHYKGQKPSHGVTVHELKLWTAIACRLVNGELTRVEKSHGFDARSFWEFHESRQDKKRPLWAFAHNLGFDLTLTRFWECLEHGIFTVGPIERPPSKKTGKPRKPWTGRLCLEGRPTFAVLNGRRGRCRFVDTANYWPTTLEAIGKKFGLPKLTCDFATCTDAELLEYCFRDSEICQMGICDLINRWVQEKCGVFQMTAASLALTNWKHTCDVRTPDGENLDVIMEPGHPATALERRAYYGGRVEPFFVGTAQGPIYNLDVNSLYPAMMGDNVFPRRHLRELKNATPRQLFRYMHAYGAVADVCIKSQFDTYPCRPHGVQLHANGHFHTTLCGPELFRALKENHVVSVGECWLYCMAPLFKNWVRTWIDRKYKAQDEQTGNAADLEFVKLISNSLSGKFGQRGEYWKDVPEQPCQFPWGQWTRGEGIPRVLHRYRGVAGKTQERVSGEEPSHSFPLISAYITSYAREYMRSLFQLCPQRSVYYSATDSIICNSDGYEALVQAQKIDPVAIGDLKVKGTYQRLRVHGCNHYELDDWVIHAGTVAKIHDCDDGERCADIWQQLPSIIGRKPNGTVIVSHVQIRSLDPTPKGFRQADGWVEPFRFSPDAEFTDNAPKRKYSRTPT